MREIIDNIRHQIHKEFEGEGSGHDWWHIHRVVENALHLQELEGGERDLIEIAALVHDVGDHKFHKEANAAETLITKLLKEVGLEKKFIQKVVQIVAEVSYKGAGVQTNGNSLEAKIVQDADRLDAIGAIGVGRAFAFGGNRNRLMYEPDHTPSLHTDFESYKNDKGHTINHFYEKLLLLKDRMQTDSGRKIAQERHQFMQTFLEQFYKEWNINE
ncbi:MAG: hypothetical protein ACI8Q1_000916 [Parvicella sp.]